MNTNHQPKSSRGWVKTLITGSIVGMEKWFVLCIGWMDGMVGLKNGHGADWWGEIHKLDQKILIASNSTGPRTRSQVYFYGMVGFKKHVIEIFSPRQSPQLISLKHQHTCQSCLHILLRPPPRYWYRQDTPSVCLTCLPTIEFHSAHGLQYLLLAVQLNASCPSRET